MTGRMLLALGALAVASVLKSAAASVEYVYDDGMMNVAVGPPSSFPSDPEMGWGNYFTAAQGGEMITEVSFALGPNFPEDREVTVALFDDPTDDLDPTDATLLTTTTIIPEFIGGSDFNVVPIAQSEVEGGFFVAVFAWAEAGIDRPAAQDTSGPNGFSWLIYNPVEKGANLDDLSANAFIENMEDVQGTFPGVWMIRATGEPSDESCAGDLDGSGAVDVADLLAMLSAWGPCEDDACPADLDANDVVDVGDLLSLLSAWGDCG